MSEITDVKKSYIVKVAIFIVAVLSAVSITIAWQHNVLQKKYADSQVTIGQMKVVNEALVRDKEQRDKSEAATKLIIAGLQKELHEKNQAYDQTIAIVDDKVGAIVKKYEKLEKNDINRLAMEKEISAARISGLWKAYCIANPEHERCKNQPVK